MGKGKLNFSKLMKNRPLRVLLCILAIVILYYLVNRYLKEGFESKPNKFYSDVAKGKKLVWFYAEWCGHCKSMHNDWDNAAREMNKNNIKMIKIDVGGEKGNQKSIAKKYDIKGYPTIMLLNKGESIETYEGDRTTQGFIKFVESKIN